jgi:hypothetical protein
MKFTEHALQKMVFMELVVNAQSSLLEGKWLRAEKDLAEAIAVIHELQKSDIAEAIR